MSPPLHWLSMGNIAGGNNSLFPSLLQLHFHRLVLWQTRTEKATAM